VRTLHWRVGLLVPARYSVLYFEHDPLDFLDPVSRREGILNSWCWRPSRQAAPGLSAVSDFAVIVAYVHILRMMDSAPIVNSMAKIDHV